MRRSASEIINDLEGRIARLEGKTASQGKAILTLEAFDENGQSVTKEKLVKCALTQQALLVCATNELRVHCYYATGTEENIFLSNQEMTIQLWCGENDKGIYYATFTLKGHAHNVFDVLPIK